MMVRVFVLSTGRSGTTTFARACSHADNFTAGHETRTRRIGDRRFRYPDQHIEVDNRLTWFLGDLEARFGDEPTYVHLLRDPEDVAASFVRRMAETRTATQRWRVNIARARHKQESETVIDAFAHGLLMRKRWWAPQRLPDVARFYVATVNTNIAWFLANKSKTFTMDLADAIEEFPRFWEQIGARGDLSGALAEFGIRYNAS